jgi:amidohydrolase
MLGTIRTFDREQRADIFRRIQQTAEHIGAASGARVTVQIDSGYSVTTNDPALTERMLPSLRRVAGNDRVVETELKTGAEDFSFYQQRVPGMFFFLGVTPDGQDPNTVPTNHSPLFFADEGALPVGVRALSSTALDWLVMNPRSRTTP